MDSDCWKRTRLEKRTSKRKAMRMLRNWVKTMDSGYLRQKNLARRNLKPKGLPTLKNWVRPRGSDCLKHWHSGSH